MLQKVWTLSNILSLLRIVCIVPITYCLVSDFPYNRLYAVGFIILAIATDFFDGYFARLKHQVTELGKILDPLADKIAVGVYAVVLVYTGDIPLWYVVVVLLRDMLILLGAVYIKKKKGIVPQSNWPGKIAVALIASVFLLQTLRLQVLTSITQILLWISVFMMIVSLAYYAERLFVGRNIKV